MKEAILLHLFRKLIPDNIGTQAEVDNNAEKCIFWEKVVFSTGSRMK
jgi:hypothetical protein